MDTNIMQTVYKALEASTVEIGKTLAERDSLEEKIKSGRYSPQTVQKEFHPKRDALNQQIKVDSEKAIQAAKSLVEKYRADAEKLDNLDPSELTDDIKLFQTGIPLLPRDIQAILERNSGNRTMTQLALRYAKDHGIETGGTNYIGGEAERQTANNLDGIIRYYSRWIDKRNAKDVLRRFFNVE